MERGEGSYLLDVLHEVIDVEGLLGDMSEEREDLLHG
jgi:hypothetical protein